MEEKPAPPADVPRELDRAGRLELAAERPRFGYRRLLRREGMKINHKRVCGL